ncbi:MAG: family 20 glycosylhydrolase [Bacteroidota bacterium]
MKHIIPTLSFIACLLLFIGCQADEASEKKPLRKISWGLTGNHFEADTTFHQGYFIIENNGKAIDGDWEFRFHAFMGEVVELTEGFRLERITGEYYRLFPTAAQKISPGQKDTITYAAKGGLLKAAMAPGGMFLVRNGQAEAVNWSRQPMDKSAVWGSFAKSDLIDYDQALALFEQYPVERSLDNFSPSVIPQPQEISLLEEGIILAETSQVQATEASSNVNLNRLHIWTSGVYWSDPARVFRDWMASLYGVEVVLHQEEKPDFPHLELIFDTNIETEAYEIFNLGPELTVVSASNPAGMLHGLATVVQSFRLEDGFLHLPLERVVDYPRFAYRGQHLDVSRNFHSKASVLKLLDLMALFKLNTLHFHLTDDEGWRLEIPDLPELTSVGGKRGFTLDEHDHLHPAYNSGPDSRQSPGSGFYTVAAFIEILEYAKERSIEVIPEFDFPGHARAAIKAMEAYARRTGDTSYLLSEASDTSRYTSIQGYPDNTLMVCQESTYKFLEKVVTETAKMYDSAGLALKTLHTGGDEVALGVWTASPACTEQLAGLGHQTSNPEEIKNILGAYFLDRFHEILQRQGIRTAGWEEIALQRAMTTNGQFEYVVNPQRVADNLLPYVWNSLAKNIDLNYDLANAGYEVVMCNVDHFYFDLAYNTDPAEPGLHWGGFNGTYDAWAFAPFDVVKTAQPPWYGQGPTEEELRTMTSPLLPTAQPRIKGIQGQLWSETVLGPDMLDYYLWPKILGLAERAWSAPASWEAIADPQERQAALAEDWSNFCNRVGQATLPLLDRYQNGVGVQYRLPPPGGKVINGQLVVKQLFPGVPAYYKIGDGAEIRYTGPVSVSPGESVSLRSGAGERRSRASYME